MAIILGTDCNDTLSGTADNDIILGFKGHDTLTGQNGDLLDGGDGNDLLIVGNDFGEPPLYANGGVGDDVFVSAKADKLPAELDLNYSLNLEGRAGDDTFGFSFGAIQDSIIDGGDGNDHLAIRTMLGGALIGGAGHDQFEVRNMRGNILAGDGNDIISVGASQAGHTFLVGEDGDDVISSVAGSSIMDGGAGRDHLSDGLDLFAPASRLDGGAGSDELRSPGRDILIGGDDDDKMESGAFANTLTGGAEADHFVYGDLVNLNSILADTITDFDQNSGDVLDVSRLLDRVGAPADPFAGGWLALDVASGSTRILFDPDGGGDNLQVIATLQNTVLSENDIYIGSDSTSDPLGHYYLADADTNQPLFELVNGSVIDPSLLAGHNLTIFAVADGIHPDALHTESVQLNLDSGAATRVENVESYALFGDQNGDLWGGLALTAGQHQITFDFYDADGAQGTHLGSDTLTFSVAHPDLLV
jgi:serralysin